MSHHMNCLSVDFFLPSDMGTIDYTLVLYKPKDAGKYQILFESWIKVIPLL